MAALFYDISANDWKGDAVYLWYEDVNGETEVSPLQIEAMTKTKRRLDCG